MHFNIFFGWINTVTLPDTCMKSGVIALTIDEGPTGYTGDVLDILEKKGVVATFHFNPTIVGSEFQAIYDSVEENGHEIGMRTSPKRSYTDDMDYEDVESDLDQQLKFLESRTSNKIKYARSPMNGALPVENVYSYFVKHHIIQTNYSVCLHDEVGEDPVDKLKTFLGPNNYKHDSFIVSVYEQRLGEERNLEEIIDCIKDNGYELVVMSDCLKGYEPGSAVPREKSSRSSYATSSCNRLISPHLLPILFYFL